MLTLAHRRATVKQMRVGIHTILPWLHAMPVRCICKARVGEEEHYLCERKGGFIAFILNYKTGQPRGAYQTWPDRPGSFLDAMANFDEGVRDAKSVPPTCR